jgi:ATP-dependent protease ClpP protease subunit
MQKKHQIPLRIINGPMSDPQNSVPRFWNVLEVNDDEAEITMYGEVCSKKPVDWWTGEPLDGLYITPEGFLEDLAQVKDKSKVTVRINSVGGDLYTALGICNRLKELNGETVAVIDGIAASAATIIAMGCKTREIAPGALFMIHEALLTLMGNYNNKALLEVNKRLEAANKVAAEAYDSATHLGVGKIRSLMAKETWYTGREAVENGFCNVLREDAETNMCMSSEKDEIIVNGMLHSLKGFRNFPGNVPVINSIQVPTMANPMQKQTEEPIKSTSINQSQGGNVTMTLEELREKHPELVVQIETAAKGSGTSEAIQAERSRLQAIEEIALTVGNPELVKEAKYGPTACTAQELAFKAMQQQAKLGTQHLNNSLADFNASGAAAVSSTPNTGNPIPEGAGGTVSEAEQIANAAALIANAGKKPETK